MVQQLVVGAHHANNRTSAQMVRGRAQNSGSQAAARQSNAPDLIRDDIRRARR